MPNTTKHCVTKFFILFIVCISSPVWAESKQPGDISEADFALMTSSSNDYNQCLQEKPASIIDQMDDPRHVADFAMKQCAEILEKLNSELENRDFPAGFRKGYIHRITNRAARHLLSGLMVVMANRQ